MQHAIITAARGAVYLSQGQRTNTVYLKKGESVRVWARHSTVGGEWETHFAITINNDPSRGWLVQHRGTGETITIFAEETETRIETGSAGWVIGDVIRRYDGKPCGWDGWTEHPNGDQTFWTDEGQTHMIEASKLSIEDMGPLAEYDSEDGETSTLGWEHWRWPMHLHCDPAMPMEDRERIATLLETAGEASLIQPKGEVGCSIDGCRAILQSGLRELPGDALANTRPLLWPPELAHYVRVHGLRISPRVLMERLGVSRDGTRPAIVHTSHGA